MSNHSLTSIVVSCISLCFLGKDANLALFDSTGVLIRYRSEALETGKSLKLPEWIKLHFRLPKSPSEQYNLGSVVGLSILLALGGYVGCKAGDAVMKPWTVDAREEKNSPAKVSCSA